MCGKKVIASQEVIYRRNIGASNKGNFARFGELACNSTYKKRALFCVELDGTYVFTHCGSVKHAVEHILVSWRYLRHGFIIEIPNAENDIRFRGRGKLQATVVTGIRKGTRAGVKLGTT